MEVSGQLHAAAPRERTPDTHWIESWVGPRAILGTMVKRKIPSSRRESNPRTPISSPYPSAIPTELSQLFLGVDGRTILEWIYEK
jgi:hypothetical protein